jgi:hypothetical protein
MTEESTLKQRKYWNKHPEQYAEQLERNKIRHKNLMARSKTYKEKRKQYMKEYTKQNREAILLKEKITRQEQKKESERLLELTDEEFLEEIRQEGLL